MIEPTVCAICNEIFLDQDGYVNHFFGDPSHRPPKSNGECKPVREYIVAACNCEEMTVREDRGTYRAVVDCPKCGTQYFGSAD